MSSQFVDECRKEWHHLGVPEPVANEMAADLEADLTEAHADGVAPEAVLGNDFFDPKAFAASWATARGVVSPGPRGPKKIRFPSWSLAASAVVCAAAVMLGLVVLVGRRMGSESVSAAALRRPGFNRPQIPGLFVGLHRVFVSQPTFAVVALGGALFLAGLVGLGVTLWFWRPWSARKRGSGFDQSVSMPGYL
jgi:hypothetical protein